MAGSAVQINLIERLVSSVARLLNEMKTERSDRLRQKMENIIEPRIRSIISEYSLPNEMEPLLLPAVRCLCAAIQSRSFSAITQPNLKACPLRVGFMFSDSSSHRSEFVVDDEIVALGWKIRPCRERLKGLGDQGFQGSDHLMDKVLFALPMAFAQISEEMRSVLPITRLLMGKGLDARLLFVSGFTWMVRWSLSTSNLARVNGRDCLPQDQRLAKAWGLYHQASWHTALHLGSWSASMVFDGNNHVSHSGVPTTVWVPKAVWVLSWASHLGHRFVGLRDLQTWYGSHVWDLGGEYGGLGFLVLQIPNLLALLINKETASILRRNDLWFGVKDGSRPLLAFLFIFIPYSLVENILFCFNKSQFDYCTVSTTIECIGEQRSLCFWDENSLHQLVVVLFFNFQEMSFHLVSEQPIGEFMVCSALGFHINLLKLIIAPVTVQDTPINDCNRYLI